MIPRGQSELGRPSHNSLSCPRIARKRVSKPWNCTRFRANFLHGIVNDVLQLVRIGIGVCAP